MSRKTTSQGRSKTQRAASLKSRAKADAELLHALDGLRSLRAPYHDVMAALVADLLERYPFVPGLPAVEIGAGTGQLRRWLPPGAGSALVHTDPSAEALEVLRHHASQANTAVASAQSLPFPAGACGGAVGLCVFDTLHLTAASDVAVAELARVLAPGAFFLHILDMATLLDKPFQEFNAQGVVPVPNVFGDPGDHQWPLDVVLFEREWLSQILHVALRMNHPLATQFGPYFSAFLLPPFDVKQAMAHFQTVATRSGVQRALALQLAAVIQMAVQQGLPAQAAIPFHSGLYLRAVMDSAFKAHPNFRVVQSDLVTRSAWRPTSTGENTRYRSFCLGHERATDVLPRRLLGAPVDDAQPAGVETKHVLTEVGAYVFVAQRL